MAQHSDEVDMPFRDNNIAHGLPQNDKFQVGVSNCDPGNTRVEDNATLPWSSESVASYLYFECTVGVMLDSGIVVHNRLPQVDNVPDSLSSLFLEDVNFALEISKGVNITCRDQYTDIVQRMGHSRYWFRLWGQALRAGYQVPIPGIRSIGGVPVIPYDENPQWAFNRIHARGNYGGIPLWHAQWSLWYTTAVPPTSNKLPHAFLNGNIDADAPLPAAIQSPFSATDDAARNSQPLTIAEITKPRR